MQAQMDRGSAGVWWRVLRFFLVEFPQVYRAELRFMLASLVLFAGPALAAFIGVQGSDELARRLLSPQLIALIQQWQGGTGADPGLRPVASPFILANNLEVGLLSFAGGVVFGLGSAYVLAMNGLALGAVAGLCQQHGLSLAFWSFVAPHGAIELSVIVIAGGAGLMLGWALLHPGPKHRAEALSTAALRAVRLLVGCLPLLVSAGLIESFLSPSAAPPEVKLAVGLLTGVALHSFLLAGGRTGSPYDAPTAPADGGQAPARALTIEEENATVSHQTLPEAWITLPSEAELRAKAQSGQKPLYDFGFIGAMGKLLAAHERIGPAFMALFRQVMFEPGVLDRQEREMVAAVAAAAQDCEY